MSPVSSTSLHRKILTDLLSIPTAPFAEHAVIAHVRAFCGRWRHVAVSTDAVGNVLVRVRQGSRRVARPVCITAHLDHPGFVADRMLPRNRVRAFWRGGVPKEYFVGVGVRFFTPEGLVRGTIRAVQTALRSGVRRVSQATIDVAGEVSPGSVGMWDLPDPAIRGSRIYARACDDLAGAAAMLCAIEELIRRERPCDAYFLFTRAEEVGFVGAIAASRLRTIPRRCVVVAMETSSELPHAPMGQGPILRVGDRASTFTSAATAYCHRVARDLARDDRSFRFQRRLMDGGTCESSAYCTLGYPATGLCVALGNYHNIDARRKRIAPEYVDLNDFDNVVKWFVELAAAPYTYTDQDTLLSAQLVDLERTYRKLLRSSVRKAC